MMRAAVAGVLAALMGSAVALGARAGSTELIDAVRRQDRAAVARLLQQQVDVNARQGDGASALHWAIQVGELELAALLIRAGADVNAANDFGVTPLMVAAANGSSAAIRALLEAKADPSLGPPGRETPLMLASWTGQTEAVTALLDAGAAIDARESERQQTALMWATAQRHPDVVRLLVARGADISARTKVTSAPGRPSRDKAGYTALMFAARSGDVESARVLLDAGAKATDAGGDGMSALTLATVRGHIPVALLLLERGADPNAAGTGYTALHWASGSWETAFTTNDITTDREGEHEWNALVGLKEGKHDLVRALLKHGADPNVRITITPLRAGATRSPTLPELTGATPYLLAAMAGDTVLMTVLREAGADPSIATKKRSTPLMAAAGLGRILGENSVEEPQLLAAAKLALEHGADVTTVDEYGNTALHYAAYHRLPTLVQLLVDNGAALDVKNMFGETPLWAADLVIQWFGGGTFKVVPTPTGDLLRRLGAKPIAVPYDKRPADWPCNEIPPAVVPDACS
ncbi:MAG: ankyrin repeat domain-containing protein [Vicinamibacterales bacterium]